MQNRKREPMLIFILYKNQRGPETIKAIPISSTYTVEEINSKEVSDKRSVC